MSVSACKACGREIRWARSPATGKMIPLQRVARVYQVHTPDGVDEARLVEPPGDGRTFYVSHFETCTDPNRFSRGRA